MILSQKIGSGEVLENKETELFKRERDNKKSRAYKINKNTPCV